MSLPWVTFKMDYNTFQSTPVCDTINGASRSQMATYHDDWMQAQFNYLDTVLHPVESACADANVSGCRKAANSTPWFGFQGNDQPPVLATMEQHDIGRVNEQCLNVSSSNDHLELLRLEEHILRAARYKSAFATRELGNPWECCEEALQHTIKLPDGSVAPNLPWDFTDEAAMRLVAQNVSTCLHSLDKTSYRVTQFQERLQTNGSVDLWKQLSLGFALQATGNFRYLSEDFGIGQQVQAAVVDFHTLADWSLCHDATSSKISASCLHLTSGLQGDTQGGLMKLRTSWENSLICNCDNWAKSRHFTCDGGFTWSCDTYTLCFHRNAFTKSESQLGCLTKEEVKNKVMCQCTEDGDGYHCEDGSGGSCDVGEYCASSGGFPKSQEDGACVEETCKCDEPTTGIGFTCQTANGEESHKCHAGLLCGTADPFQYDEKDEECMEKVNCADTVTCGGSTSMMANADEMFCESTEQCDQETCCLENAKCSSYNCDGNDWYRLHSGSNDMYCDSWRADSCTIDDCCVCQHEVSCDCWLGVWCNSCVDCSGDGSTALASITAIPKASLFAATLMGCSLMMLVVMHRRSRAHHQAERSTFHHSLLEGSILPETEP
jgi:hypothetical protein